MKGSTAELEVGWGDGEGNEGVKEGAEGERVKGNERKGSVRVAIIRDVGGGGGGGGGVGRRTVVDA